MHPDELDLLAFADGGRDDLRAHVESCEECSRAVAEARAGRDALRASGLVEPPPLEPLVAALPARRTRRLVGWPRVAAILAPVAAGAIAIAVVTTRGEEQRPAAQPEAATAMKAQEDTGRAAAPTLLPVRPLVIRTVAGPRARVERRLRSARISFDVVKGFIVVRGAPRAAVERALRGIPDGDIVVQFAPG